MKGLVIPYSAAELAWISDNRSLVIGELFSRFQAKFNRPDVSQIHLHSLRKRKGWKTGRTGQFRKGHVPSQNARPKGPNKTSFSKGNRPHNYKPLGSTRLSKDGYIEIKTKDPRTWTALHNVIWEKKYGVIPRSHLVIFKDGNKKNLAIENLMLVSRNENLQINRLQCSAYPKPLQPTIRTIGLLKAKMSELNKAGQAD